MDSDIRDFAETLGRKVLSRDWTEVRELLAPWLRNVMSIEQVREFFETSYSAMLRENGVQALHYPEHTEPSVGGDSFMSAAKLREPIDWLGQRFAPYRTT